MPFDIDDNVDFFILETLFWVVESCQYDFVVCYLIVTLMNQLLHRILSCWLIDKVVPEWYFNLSRWWLKYYY